MPTKSKSNTIPKARIYCPSCGRTLGEERFYFIRGTHGASAADRCLPICKDCCMRSATMRRCRRKLPTLQLSLGAT